jgi:hypothetical protein
MMNLKLICMLNWWIEKITANQWCTALSRRLNVQSIICKNKSTKTTRINWYIKRYSKYLIKQNETHNHSGRDIRIICQKKHSFSKSQMNLNLIIIQWKWYFKCFQWIVQNINFQTPEICDYANRNNEKRKHFILPAMMHHYNWIIHYLVFTINKNTPLHSVVYRKKWLFDMIKVHWIHLIHKPKW